MLRDGISNAAAAGVASWFRFSQVCVCFLSFWIIHENSYLKFVLDVFSVCYLQQVVAWASLGVAHTNIFSKNRWQGWQTTSNTAQTGAHTQTHTYTHIHTNRDTSTQAQHTNNLSSLMQKQNFYFYAIYFLFFFCCN